MSAQPKRSAKRLLARASGAAGGQARSTFSPAVCALAFAAALFLPRDAEAQAEAATFVDRVAVRFTAPETGGIARPRFIFERELAFEARLEALADSGGFVPTREEPFLERHIGAALERHMAEVLLGSLEINPEPTASDVAVRAKSARSSLLQQVGGESALEQAARAEGMGLLELSAILARRARASLYLDRMVATMLTPSDTELRIVHRTTRTPFSKEPYEAVAPLLSRWYVAQRLNAAVKAFYEGARSRIELTVLTGRSKSERDP